MRIALGLFATLLAALPLFGEESSEPARTRNPAAVQEVLSGRRSLANSAWWGFDRSDATECLQAALKSGAKTLLIPYLGDPWVVRPLQLPSNLEILLEPGVVLLAKRGEFLRGGDSLLTATGQSNLVLRGY